MKQYLTFINKLMIPIPCAHAHGQWVESPIPISCAIISNVDSSNPLSCATVSEVFCTNVTSISIFLCITENRPIGNRFDINN